MFNVIAHLNYLAVFGTAVVGFLLGWLWYSPALFANAWKAEMKITEEMMKEAMEKGMAPFLLKAFCSTLLSTFALAALIKSHGSETWLKGAELGLFVGALISGARMLNSGVWEKRSCRLLAINVGHEVVLFALQGAILGAWH